jgi:hypothetical protein
MDRTKPEEAVKELTMLLMYLTRFHERDRFIETSDMAWKGYDFDIINKLDDEDYIGQGSHRSKSVVITDKGLEFSRELLDKYHIDGGS